jgi:hypothetical protein
LGALHRELPEHLDRLALHDGHHGFVGQRNQLIQVLEQVRLQLLQGGARLLDLELLQAKHGEVDLKLGPHVLDGRVVLVLHAAV